MQIQIFCDKITERFEYIAKFLFEQVLKIETKITNSRKDFLTSKLPRINYSKHRIADVPQVSPHGMLFESDIRPISVSITKKNELDFFFESDSFMDFDFFAASFYLISRYEEYLSYTPDNHGRFGAEESFLFKNNLLHRPIINEWMKCFKTRFCTFYPEVIFPEVKFSFLPTFDIDNAFAYRGRGFFRGILGFGRDIVTGRLSSVVQRVKTIILNKKDKFDTYDYIIKSHKNLTSPIFFFLIASRSKYDTSIQADKKILRELIKKLSVENNIGIHPSYSSNGDTEILCNEIKKLSNVLETKITQSRQHFLQLKIPETYEKLIKYGITNDYTMGYASQVGFRAGTCTSFPFFNLRKNKPTNLLIYPFAVMDATLKVYLNLSPNEACKKIEELIVSIKNVDGIFCSLWHNETFPNDENNAKWRKVHDFMLEKIKNWLTPDNIHVTKFIVLSYFL